MRFKNMFDEQVLRRAYEAVDEEGNRYGKTGPADERRWKDTLRFLPKDVKSILDCGCDVGHWLNSVARHRPTRKLVGIDIAGNRIKEGMQKYPHLDLRVATLETLVQAGERFEVVTALEVLEHIPDWERALDSMFELAQRLVLITVPYKEVITKTICIHCGKITPLYGHLRSYDESMFVQREGWRLGFGYIRRKAVGQSSLPRRLHRLVKRRKDWLVVTYARALG